MIRKTALVLLFDLALSCAVRAAEPWDAPFAADAAAIIQRASAVKAKKDAEVVLLLEEWRCSIDSAGRMTSTVRRVYRVVTEDAVESWGSIEQDYAPWHERRPELRARVISRDGAVHWLDEKTIADAPVLQFDATIFSDNRTLRAPLPSVAPGAVVEYELTTRETAPALDAGSLHRIAINPATGVERFHVVIDAPPGITLRKLARNIAPDSLHETAARKGTQVELDAGPFAARTEWEDSAPPEANAGPLFEFSTAHSWQAVATAYSTIVDRQIANADLHALLPPTQDGESALAHVARIVAALHDKIRYTGVEFGQAAVVPRTPAETITRGYGDCKDKSALLVAMLRAAGLRARVALLRSGWGLDVSADLPGFGSFDHAIVYAELPEPLWIDATAATTRVGTLPIGVEGHLALIADAATTQLTRLPESSSADNRAIHVFELRMSDSGSGSLTEAIDGYGRYDTQMRDIYGDPARVTETLERQIKNGYKAEALGAYSAMARNDFSRAYHVSVEALRTPVLITVEDEAVAAISPVAVFGDISYALKKDDADAEPGKDKRKHDFLFSPPFQLEYRYLIKPPTLFHPKTLPASVSVEQDGFSYTRAYRSLDNGAVEIVTRVDTGKRRLTPGEFESLKDKLKSVLQQPVEVIEFTAEPAEALALGNIKEAVRLIQQTPQDPTPASLARRARVLSAAADRDGALAAARKAVALDATSSTAWLALASASQHDSFGREELGDWNAAETEKALREAVKTEKTTFVAKLRLADLLLKRAAVDSPTAPAGRAESIGLLRDVLKKNAIEPARIALVTALLASGRTSEADTEAKLLSGSTVIDQAMQLAVVALRDGASRAVINSQSIGVADAQRAQLLFEASRVLFQLRRYEICAELVKASQRIAPSPTMSAFSELAAKVRRREDPIYANTDPRYPVRALIVAALSGGKPPVAAQLFTRQSVAVGDSMIAAVRRRAEDKRREFTRMSLPTELLEDVLSGGDLDKDGDDEHGYKVSAPNTGMGAISLVAYVVKQDDGYRVLATQDQLAPVGRLVFDLLHHNDLKAAQAWLDRVVTGPIDIQVARFYLRSTRTPAVRNLWAGVTPESRGTAPARLAAATLIAQYAPDDASITLLKEAYRVATNRVERGQIAIALCDAYANTARWSDLLAAAHLMDGNYSVSDQAFGYIVQARTEAKQWKELIQDAELHLKTSKNDRDALYVAAYASLVLNNDAQTSAYLARLLDDQWIGAEARTLSGWRALLHGTVDDKTLKLVDERTGGDDADSLYLAGLIQVALGKVDDARHSLASGLAKADLTKLDAKPWVLLGKIQAQYGLANAASTSFAQARKASSRDASSAWALTLIDLGTEPGNTVIR